ncbi:MAG TPA: serine/threonine-protein kinase [Polyangiaceae bacterium]
MKEIDVGQIIGNKYVLVRLIGAGAMGQVWVARHQALQQPFALKLMTPPASQDAVQAFEGVETSLRRFQNEAQIAAALSRKSRHIAQVTDYGIEDGTAYLVMELLEGEGLDRRIGQGRRLEPAEVSAVVSQIAKGLAAAHAEGVTHRDLKPANVFLAKTEEGDLLVKLLDFGIAQMARRIVRAKGDTQRAPTRLTMKGLVLGSPAYMSPEQAMAESPDARADVWALAVLAFEALAGVSPFHATTADETILRICNFQPTHLRDVWSDATPELEAVFARAFEDKIDQRFQGPVELADALAAALPSPARVLSARPPAPAGAVSAAVEEGGVSLRVPMRSRRVLPAIAAGVGGAIVIAGAVYAMRGPSRAPTTQPQATASVEPAAIPSSIPAPETAAPEPSEPSEPSEPTGRPRLRIHRPPTLHHSATSTPTAAPAPTPTSKTVDKSAVF